MWFWPKSKVLHAESFERGADIVDDFLLLGYTNARGQREMDLVGTDGKRSSLVILSRRQKDSSYEVSERIPVRETVLSVIPYDFDLDGHMDYLVVSEHSGGYYSALYKGGPSPLRIEMGTCDTMPFILSYYGDLKPTLFVQEGGATQIVSLVGGRFVRSPAKEPFGMLAKGHSSGFVDIDGDGIADLVLIVADGGRDYIETWVNGRGGFAPSPRTELPEGAGPVAFADFSGTGSVDIAFISNEPGGSYLNILYNQRPPFCSPRYPKNCLGSGMIMVAGGEFGFTTDKGKEFYRRFRIDELFQGCRGVTAMHGAGAAGARLPSFLGVSDFNCDSYPDLLLLTEDLATGEVTPRILLNREGRDFVPSEDGADLPGTRNCLTASFFDSKNKGKPDVMVNVVEGGAPVLKLFRNKADGSAYHITVTTIQPEMARNVYTGTVLGSTYFYNIAEQKRIRLGMQPPQSGFSPLQSPIVTIGLGNTNVFISSVHTGIPRTRGEYPSKGVFSGKVVPNSDLVMQPKGNKITTNLYLNFDSYGASAIPTLLLFLFMNILVVIYFTVQERKQDRRDRKKNRLRVNFDAL